MTDHLNMSEIKKRSISGAKWLVVMNGLGMPAAFLISLMLGRVGPETLGVYALAQILINVITTFLVYGGPSVLSVFMAKLHEPDDRGRFVFSYLMILIISMIVMLSLLWLFPPVLEFMLQRNFAMRYYGWFVLLVITVVATEAFANIASGLMLIKVTAIARQMMRMILLPLVTILFFFKRNILLDYGMLCILGGFFAGCVAATLICAIGIFRDRQITIQTRWFVPHGFWAFSLSTMAIAVFSFLYSNFDRMAILSITNVKILGTYQAVISINALLEIMPTLLIPALIPTFSNIIERHQQAVFKRAFTLLCRWSVIPITIVSLIIMGFSEEILSVFGKQYVEYAYLLVLFGFVNIIRSLRLPSYTILTCKEKNIFRFMQSFLMVVGQCALTLIFMSSYGVIAIAGAKMICVSVASVAGVLYVFYGLDMVQEALLSYKAALFTGTIMTVLRIYLMPSGWLSEALLTLSCIAIFIILSRLSFTELHEIMKLILHREGDIITVTSELAE